MQRNTNIQQGIDSKVINNEVPGLQFLGKPGGQYAVRLVKPLFDAPKRQYFQEYEKLGDRDPPKHPISCEKYIMSEDTTYAIEITLKKGFSFGKYDQLKVSAFDIASEARMGTKFVCRNSLQRILAQDEVYLVEHLDSAVIEGKVAHGVSLSFQELVTGVI